MNMRKLILAGGAVMGTVIAFVLLNTGGTKEEVVSPKRQSVKPGLFREMLSSKEKEIRPQRNVGEKRVTNEKVVTNPYLHAYFERSVQRQTKRQEMMKRLEPYFEARKRFEEARKKYVQKWTGSMLEARKYGDVEKVRQLEKEALELQKLMYEFEMAVREGDQGKVSVLSAQIEAMVGAPPPVRPRLSEDL